MVKKLICTMLCSNCKKISHFDYYDFIHGRLEEFEQCPFCGAYGMPELDEIELDIWNDKG